LQLELDERLRRKRDELYAKMEALGQPDIGDATAGEDVEVRLRELQGLTASIESLTRRLQGALGASFPHICRLRVLTRLYADADKEIERLAAVLREAREELQRVQNQQADDSSSMTKQQKSTERYMAKRNLLLGRKDECSRNVRDLGVLPEEAFEKYTSDKLERVRVVVSSPCICLVLIPLVCLQLMKKLHTAKEGLKKFAHVNKKAFEQYANFTKQRDQLLERRADLDKSAEAIEELVDNLDMRKDEAIERTFKQVASNFEEVFEKLVPAGKGKLIIQRRVDQVCSL
jgi:structural maintenance of chromosome 3 (chondroitin sulfate proteoglycan 6)